MIKKWKKMACTVMVVATMMIPVNAYAQMEETESVTQETETVKISMASIEETTPSTQKETTTKVELPEKENAEKPGKTMGVKAVATRDGKVQISWEPLEGATEYHIYRAATLQGKYAYIGKTDEISYIDEKNLVDGEIYYYCVRAFNYSLDGVLQYGLFSDKKSVQILVYPEQSVLTSVKQAAATSDDVKITWKRINGVAKYRIYRKTDGRKSFGQIAEVSNTSTAYIDKTAINGKSCQYMVRAYKVYDGKIIFGSYSKPLTITVRKAPGKSTMTGARQYSKKDSDVKVAWKTISGASGYQIYRKTAGGSYHYLLTVPAGKTYSMDRKAVYGKTYYYRVRAYRTYGKTIVYGSYSDSRKVTVIKQRTVVKNRSRAVLNVSCLLQNPGFPSGCEPTSLAIVLRYRGFRTSISQLVYHYMPWESSFYGKYNFNQAYLGSPTSYKTWGGCYPNVLVQTAKNYFRAVGSRGYQAYNVTGASLSKLYDYIDQGCPVIVWGTMYMGSSSKFVAGRTIYGETLYWQTGSHTLVLTGYDKVRGIVYVADPLVGNTSYSAQTFWSKFCQLGKRAVVIK